MILTFLFFLNNGFMFPNVTKIIKPLSSPKYGRKLLHNLLKETLGDRQLQ